MLDILSIGNLARDITYAVREFPQAGQETLADSFRETHGGAAGNVASYAAYTFGCKSAIKSVIGNDLIGAQLVRRLSERDRVITSQVVWVQGGSTASITIVTNCMGEKIFFTYPGCTSTIGPEDIIQSLVLDKAKFVYVAPCDPAMAFRIIDFAKSQDRTVAYNPGGTLTPIDISNFSDILPKVDFLFLNRDEGQRYSNCECLSEVIAFYMDRGINTLILTDGHNGSIVTNRNETFFQPAYLVDEIEPLGPGDAYASAFISTLCEVSNLRLAALRGSQLGAFVVTRWGVREQIPSFQQLLDFCQHLQWRQYRISAWAITDGWPEEERS